ncbi:guanine deaminase-like isoform X2 [Ptychodera flava]|uniref:guanine deaminase-like isoform X2 n=1 Tax=Ptychodera flava TaxID=63121 RepID=UPI00396A8330
MSNNNLEASEWTVFRGTVIHSTHEEAVVPLKDAILGVRGSQIKFLSESVGGNIDDLAKEYGFNPKDVKHLKDGQFLIPGFIDTHIHAPQYVFTGTGYDLPLMEWLDKYTFPTESKFSDIKFADRAYSKAVKRTIKHGTTTACYFATLHAKAAVKLAEIIDKAGQRAFVGKVNMDQNSPKFYVEKTENSLSETKWFIEQMNERQYSRVSAVITPRFVPTCTVGLMDGLSDLAKTHNLPIQSHLCESKNEVSFVKKLHPETSYTDVYNDHGLLSERTIMAHCVYCDDKEIELLKETGTGIAHCPNSNTFLASGILDVRKLLERKVKVGLGTDVSGGYNPSILDAIRQSVGVSKLLAVDRENYSPISYQEAFRLATLGGSQVLGLEDKIGNFEVGKEFDALLIDTKCADSPFDTFNDEYADDLMDIFRSLSSLVSKTNVFFSQNAILIL